MRLSHEDAAKVRAKTNPRRGQVVSSSGRPVSLEIELQMELTRALDALRKIAALNGPDIDNVGRAMGAIARDTVKELAP